MLNECADCTTAYAIDLQACPHCGSIEVTGDGRHGNLDAPAVEPASVFTSEMTATVTAEATHPAGTVVDDDGNPVPVPDEDTE